MKKLVTIMVVLALATVSNAVVLELSADGVVTPGQAVVTLPTATSTFVVDISDSQGYTFGQDGYAMLVTTPADGTVAGGVVVAGHLNTGFLPVSAQDLIDLGFGGMSAVYSFVGSTAVDGAGQTWAAGKVIDEITFQKIGAADAYITLYTSADGATFTAADSIKVVVPEPMTMSLLGLGGLFLRRKMA